MSELERVVALIQRPQLLAGMDRMQPELRTLVTELMDRFEARDATPRPIAQEGAAMALWGTQDRSEAFLEWHRAQGGVVRALEVLLAAIGYERKTYEWDNSIWALARARPAAGLSNLGLVPWLWMRRAMDAATPEERAAAREIAGRARAWRLRAALAFVFPDDDALWTSDDEHELRHAEIYDYTAIRFGVLAAMRRQPDLDHAQLAEYFEISEVITPAKLVEALGEAAVAPLRLVKAYGELASLARPDSLRALLELSDAEASWEAIGTLAPTASTIAALAPMFSSRRPRRVLALQLARGFLAELVTVAPDEAKQVDDPFVATLLADTGALLPPDESWVSPWAKPPKEKKPRATKKKKAEAIDAEGSTSAPRTIELADTIHWEPGERGNLANPNPDMQRDRDEEIEKRVMELAAADKAFIGQLLWVTDATALRLWRAVEPQRWYGQTDDVEHLLARFELAELDSLIAFVASKPDTLAGLSRVESPKVAPLMARGFAMIKKLEKIGKAWLDRFPEAAVLGLLAGGDADKKQREANTKALAYLATRAPQLVQEAIAKLGVELTLEELAKAGGPALPARAPKVPDFIDVARLPRPIRIDRAAALQGPALGEFVQLLAATLPGGQPALDAVAARYTEESLAQTAWSVFRQWLFAGAPPKHKWAMYAVGRFPDDDNARALGRLAREWAPRGNSARAQEAIEALATMQTQAGLIEIYDISNKVQSRALRARAEIVFEAVAGSLGLGTEELADRLVPELSADDLAFGELRAVLNAQLIPHLIDPQGQRVDKPPADEAGRWRELEKMCKSVAKAQVARLEQSMAEAHRMPYSHFSEIYMMHSLIKHLARSLVWGAYRDDKLELAFSLADEGPLDLAGNARDLPLDARYGIVHPVELTAADRTAWAQRLPAQPFAQLARPVFPAESGLEVSLVLATLIGKLIPTAGLLELQRRGWRRGDSPQGGRYYTIERSGAGWYAEVAFSPGIYLGNPLEETMQTIEGAAFNAEPPARPALFSEIQRDVLGLVR